MPSFGEKSTARLKTCVRPIQDLCYGVIQVVDCTVLCGLRGKEAQNQAYIDMVSKVDFPYSAHNVALDDGTEDPNGLSPAVDLAPWRKGIGVPWPDKATSTEDETTRWREWYMFLGFVRGIAYMKNIKIRCGADWDGDFEIRDQNFHDLPHIELKD